MKIRIKGDSLRIRLTRSEVEQLADIGVVEQTTRFPGGALLGTRVRRTDASQMTAAFDGGLIELRLPHEQAMEWARSETVSWETYARGVGGEMYLLLEKDFQCLHARREEEDDADAYPNPAGACVAV